MSVLDISEKHDLSFFDVREYIQRFVDKGLVDISLDEILRKSVKRVNNQ